MKKLINIFLLLQVVNLFSQENIKVNDSLYSIIKYDSELFFFKKFNTVFEISDLSLNEIIEIEKVIKPQIDSIKVSRKKYFDLFYSRKINNRNSSFVYRRQYIPVIDNNGDKLIYINSFCDNSYSLDWRKVIEDVADGGSCYFQIYLNLTKKKVIMFSINSLG